MFRNVMQALKQVEKLNREIEGIVEEATSGGGVVRAKVNALGEIVELKISPEVVDPEDVETLEDLVVAAVNEARRKAKEKADEKAKKLFEKLGLPYIPGMM